MLQLKQRWREPSFIFDAFQTVVAVAVAITLALDMTGIWSDAPWVSENLPGLTFIVVSVLIVSSFLERQITLQKILDQIENLPRAGIELEDRRDWKESLEVRLEHAQHVDILGLSLVGLAGRYWGFLRTKALAGCRLRILLADPDAPAVASVAGNQSETIRKQDIERSVEKLECLLDTGNAQLRYTSLAPPFSLVAIDPAKQHGEVQIELFIYKCDSTDRPHFILNRSEHQKWYDFFCGQFDKLWIDARPHEASI